MSEEKVYLRNRLYKVTVGIRNYRIALQLDDTWKLSQKVTGLNKMHFEHIDYFPNEYACFIAIAERDNS